MPVEPGLPCYFVVRRWGKQLRWNTVTGPFLSHATAESWARLHPFKYPVLRDEYIKEAEIPYLGKNHNPKPKTVKWCITDKEVA